MGNLGIVVKRTSEKSCLFYGEDVSTVQSMCALKKKKLKEVTTGEWKTGRRQEQGMTRSRSAPCWISDLQSCARIYLIKISFQSLSVTDPTIIQIWGSTYENETEDATYLLSSG